ncbi:MAG TPA: tetratricopeptide repeat protein [Thermoanaerobaculia bacterium]|nr:tetratricopeptide repeat protein [Thermoanaerobaculia bacterium]
MTPPASTATTTCPHCGTRLRLSSPGEAPVRLRVTCGSCQASFHVRWPGSGAFAATGTVWREAGATGPAGPPGATPAPSLIAELGTMGSATSAGSRLAEAQIRTTPLPSPTTGGAFVRQHAFAPGDLVAAGRYRVVRFLAEGGMGEVFEVEDLELGGRLAAKTVRADVASDPATMERFRREIQLSRRVTHPNVCRIFDVARDRPNPATDEGTTFLTMELLLGETLAERIRTGGAMAPQEALPIIRQIASALDAAHDAGVIHRDLKPGNVILVPGKDGAVRAVVTDFGLARTESAAGEKSATMTAAGFFIGTPAYISPEQIEGGVVTPAVDVYAFGIVIYEMLTGSVPFTGETALATAVKRLQQAPPSPRLRGAAIDAAWEAAILRCLERRPEARFARAGAMVAALDGPARAVGAGGSIPPEPPAEIPPEPPTPPAMPIPPAAREPEPSSATRQPPRKRAATALLAAVILASFAVLAYRIVAWRNEQRLRQEMLGASLGEPVKARRSVAVLGFKDRSGHSDSAWLSGALAEMLGTELASTRDLRVIAGEEVARLKRDLALSDSESLARDTLERIRAAIGADYVVLGSYTALAAGGAQDLRLDLRLQDTHAGETAASIAATGTEAKLFDLVAQTGARLRRELGVATASTAAAARAPRPASPEAARLYAEGLDRLRNFDPQAARDLLARAVAADPDNPLTRSALASAWASLGYDAKAGAEAKKALELARGLPEEQRLAIEGRFAETAEDWPRAIEIYRSLFRAFPDDLDHGLRLATAETAGGRPQEAEETLAALRRLPEPGSEDPRIDLAEAAAAEALADFPRQRKAAAAGASRADRLGAHLLAAPARLSECRALRNLGQAAAGQAACAAARALYERAGDQAGVADAVTQAANLLFDRGDLAGARRLFEQALGTYRTIGNKGAEAGALNNLAVVLRRQGETPAAVGLYEQALALSRETGDRRGEASSLANLAAGLSARGDLAKGRELFERSLALRREQGDKAGEAATLDNLGAVLRRQGDLAGARQRQEEALAIRRAIGQKIGEAASLNGLGSTLLDQGDLAAAKDRFSAAFALCQAIGNRSLGASARFGLAEVLARQGDLGAARKGHEEALAVRSELGEKSGEAASRLALAQVEIAAGDAGAAEPNARAAGSEFERQGMVADQALALVIAAEADSRSGRAAADRTEVARARTLIAGSQDLRTRLAVAVRAARLAPASEAEKELRAALADATRSGFVEARLEATLALAAIDAARGRSAESRAALEGVAKEAAAKGYLELASRARAVLGKG